MKLNNGNISSLYDTTNKKPSAEQHIETVITVIVSFIEKITILKSIDMNKNLVKIYFLNSFQHGITQLYIMGENLSTD